MTDNTPEGLPPLADLSALVLVTGFACTTWATCEPPQTEPSPYKPLNIKRPADYRPLVSMTRSKP